MSVLWYFILALIVLVGVILCVPDSDAAILAPAIVHAVT